LRLLTSMKLIRIRPGFRLHYQKLDPLRVQSPPRRLPIRATTHHATKSVDIVGLGNLCLDIRVPVKSLPLRKPGWRKELIDAFFDSPIEGSVWETGGITNTLYLTSRLGLKTTALGHLGDDVYASFCKDCLAEERVDFHSSFKSVACSTEVHCVLDHPFLTKTPICLVVVDLSQRHVFVSQFQVTPGPVFCHRSTMLPTAVESIKAARGLIMNGYAFQEYGADVVEFAFEEALDSGTSTFFDPGPFGVSLMRGTPQEREMLIQTLRRSNVILATEGEARMLTGESNAMEAGKALRNFTTDRTKWVVVKLGKDGSLFFQRGSPNVIHTEGFEVPVSDTVGCGDSFAAAIAYGFLKLEGQDTTGVLELANAVGAITATGCGAGRNVANLDEVRRLLLRQRTSNSVHNQHEIEAALELLDSSENSLLVNGASC